MSLNKQSWRPHGYPINGDCGGNKVSDKGYVHKGDHRDIWYMPF